MPQGVALPHRCRLRRPACPGRERGYFWVTIGRAKVDEPMKASVIEVPAVCVVEGCGEAGAKAFARPVDHVVLALCEGCWDKVQILLATRRAQRSAVGV
jgi:hypothetical protein